MISLSTARQLILENTPPLPPTTLPLHQALGLILHSPATADSDLPAYSRSAMDGYAIPLDDPSTHFTVIGEIQPGEKSSLTLHHGETARIFTGSLIPNGAGRVIPQENVQLHGSSITILTPTSQTYIRHQGEDARQGDLLLHPGTLLGPAEISLLAQIGVTHPSVFPRPRVFHCVTGNELVDPSTTPAPGQIRDSNSPLISALLHSQGAQLVAHSRSPDDLNTLLSTIKNTHEDWDALLISGGASVGDYDFGAKSLLALGFTIHFRQISLRPGKPLIFATRGSQIAFVIPGNPVSHFVTFHLAIRLALDLLKSTPPSWPLLHAQLLSPIPTLPNPRETFWPAALQIIDHQLHATPLHWQSSGDLLGLLNAHALIPIPPNSPPPPPSTLTPVLLLAFP